MARERQRKSFERIPVLLDDILMTNIAGSSQVETTSHIFHEIVRNLSQTGNNVPPLLITAEDREQLQTDRRKAIECEKQVVSRRHEKYYDLVDRVQGVLRHIEEKKSRGFNRQTVSDVSNSELSLSKSPSDFNNNPSPKHHETLNPTDNESNFSNRKVTAGYIEDFSKWENSRQGQVSRRKNNSGRYSLPATFESSQFNFGDPCIDSEPKLRPRSQTLYTRPYLFSDNPLNLTHNIESAEEKGRQFSFAQNPGFSSTWRDLGATSKNCVNSSSSANSLCTGSANNHSRIDKQMECLALEQKRLEDHFSTLQGQLFAEFQKQQNKLLQMYQESFQLESGAERSMQSIMERSYESESEGTVVLNTSDKENFVLNYTEELPKSPFMFSPKVTPKINRKVTPELRSSVKSFSSEASAQEFYDIKPLRARTTRPKEINQTGKQARAKEKVQKPSPEAQVSEQTGKNTSHDFGVHLITSPKIMQLNSFESQAKVKEIKAMQHCKFSVVSAYAKGFLTRRLFQTEKVNGLVMTVKDARNVLKDMQDEASSSLTDRSFKERVNAQLQSAQIELRKIFLDPSPHVRMQILKQNRRLLKEKQARNGNKLSKAAAGPTRPRLSTATMKKRFSRQGRNSQEKKPKSDITSTPSPSAAIKVSRLERTPPDSTKQDAEKTPVAVVVTMTTASTTTACTTTPVSFVNAGLKQARNQPGGKVTKHSKPVAANKKRKTWDVGVLKPIQGRISPTIPDKTRLSGDKKQSTVLAAKKTGQKLASDYLAGGPRGTSVTGGKSRTNTKTYDKIDTKQGHHVIDSKQGHHVIKSGAKRSLAANLSNK